MAKKILLVEDDSFIIDIYKTSLDQAGFEVEVAEGGEQALRFLEEEIPDLMLLDIVLPDVDGWEVLKEIKENSDLSDLKVYVLSNLGQKNEIDKGMNLGADEYFIKAHHTPSQIVEKVKEEFNK